MSSSYRAKMPRISASLSALVLIFSSPLLGAVVAGGECLNFLEGAFSGAGEAFRLAVFGERPGGNFVSFSEHQVHGVVVLVCLRAAKRTLVVWEDASDAREL